MKSKKKSFIRSAHLGVLLIEWEENKIEFRSAFLHCNLLEEFVSSKPKSFTVEQWESNDDVNWNKVSETTYHEIDWQGHVDHSDPVEMSACTASIDFTYGRAVQNCDFMNVSVIVEDHLFIREFIDLTVELKERENE